MLFQESIGIDIQSDRISLVYLKGSVKGIKMVGHAVVHLDPTMTDSQRSLRIEEIYEEFRAANLVGSPKIYICLPREIFLFREIEFPVAVRENIESTLGYEMEKYIPLPLDDIFFDFHFLNGSK